MEIAKAAGKPVEPCWRVDAVFTPELFVKVPQAAQGMSFICAGCVAIALWFQTMKIVLIKRAIARLVFI